MEMYRLNIRKDAIYYCFGRNENIYRLMEYIRENGKEISISAVIDKIIDENIYVYPECLIASGQEYIDSILPKITEYRLLLKEEDLHNLMFLYSPDNMQKALNISDQEKEEMLSILKKGYSYLL